MFDYLHKAIGRDEDGGITVLSLFLLLCMMLAGGLAIDTSNAVKTRADLQIAADMAGHAALTWRQTRGAEDSKLKAIEFATRNAPPNARKAVLKVADVEFGRWDETKNTFVADPSGRGGVRVTARMIGADDNGLRTFLMKLIGLSELDINARSVWLNGPSPCINGGFAANGIVDLRSNGAYGRGFCMHSNTHVELQQNNYFAEGSTVSMPDVEDLVVPASGFEKNTGLYQALRSGSKDLSGIFDGLAAMAEAYEDPHFAAQPSYITIMGAKSVEVSAGGKKGGGKKDRASEEDDTASKTLAQSDLTRNAVNIVSCGGKTLKIGNDEVLSEVVIVTDCDVKFGAGAALENAILVTTSAGKRSVTAPSGFRLGRDDQCAQGGGASIITLGGVEVAAGLEVYGGQIIAGGDIGFTANANGLEGVNFIADGEIDGTSNGDMGFCPDRGMDRAIEVNEVRMVL